MRTLFLCEEQPHPFHLRIGKWAESTPHSYEGIKNIPKGYKTYLTEGMFNRVILARDIGLIDKKSRIVNIFSDPRLYQLISGKKFNPKTNMVEDYPLWKRWIVTRNIRKLDYAICIGNFQAELLRRVAPNVPRVIIKPMADEIFYRHKSPLKNKNVLFVGNGNDYYVKGLDFLIECFLKANVKGSKLFIVGDGWEDFKERYKSNPKIRFVGKATKEDIIQYGMCSKLFCLFGRGESYSFAVLEAKAMGLNIMVSNLVGAKEEVNSRYVYSHSQKDLIIQDMRNILNPEDYER